MKNPLSFEYNYLVIRMLLDFEHLLILSEYDSLFYYYALKELQVPTTMHLYPAGGHGYGLRDGGFSVSQWPLRAAAWLQSLEATNKH